MRFPPLPILLLSLFLLMTAAGCDRSDAVAADDGKTKTDAAAADSKGSDGDAKEGDTKAGGRGDRSGGGDRHSGGRPGGMGGMQGGEPQAAVPVEVATASRRPISAYLETNGTLEAEYDVELLARASGPIVELLAEEGMKVRKGQLLARIDPAENRARMEISRVNLEETEIAWERAQKLNKANLLSQEDFEQARNAYESAQAQFTGDKLLYDYTQVKAPFDGVVVARYIKLAQTVSNNQQLFRLTDFDPLLCPIQVPERELPRLELGQTAYVQVEAWPETRFPARVLRISPVIDASTGTVKVTLEVQAGGKLRPGMFASIFLETEHREDALVIPKAALSLESIGDTVYVADADKAGRREVELGFHEGDSVEILSGLSAGDQVIVVGQDGLSDGTPIKVMGKAQAPGGEGSGPPAGDWPDAGATGPPGGHPGGGPPGTGPPAGRGGLDLSDPATVERIKERMKERGLSDEQIEERLKQMREGGGRGGRHGGGE